MGARWSHDYPRADLHLPQIIEDVTAIDTHVGGSNVFDLDDPDLFKYPMAYISEPGFWTMSEAEVQGLRNYFLKGGFVIFDDFEAEQWHNFEAQVRRALPEYRLIEVDVTHPIYHVFFDIKALDFPHPLVNVVPRYYAIFEENDPRRRMMGDRQLQQRRRGVLGVVRNRLSSGGLHERGLQARGELHRLRAHALNSWSRGFVDEQRQPISSGPSPGAHTSALLAGMGFSGLGLFDVQLPVSQRLRASLDALEIGILAWRDLPGGSVLVFKATRLFHLMPVLSRAFALSFKLCRSSTVCQWSPPLQDVHACRPRVALPRLPDLPARLTTGAPTTGNRVPESRRWVADLPKLYLAFVPGDAHEVKRRRDDLSDKRAGPRCPFDVLDDESVTFFLEGGDLDLEPRRAPRAEKQTYHRRR